MEGQAAKLSKAIQESSTTYALMLKSVFLYIMSRSSFFKATKAARLTNIAKRTAQDWAQRLRNEPDWDIYEKKKNKINRKKS